MLGKRLSSVVGSLISSTASNCSSNGLTTSLFAFSTTTLLRLPVLFSKYSLNLKICVVLPDARPPSNTIKKGPFNSCCCTPWPSVSPCTAFNAEASIGRNTLLSKMFTYVFCSLLSSKACEIILSKIFCINIENFVILIKSCKNIVSLAELDA